MINLAKEKIKNDKSCQAAFSQVKGGFQSALDLLEKMEKANKIKYDENYVSEDKKANFKEDLDAHGWTDGRQDKATIYLNPNGWINKKGFDKFQEAYPKQILQLTEAFKNLNQLEVATSILIHELLHASEGIPDHQDNGFETAAGQSIALTTFIARSCFSQEREGNRKKKKKE
jgi:protoporphyrinogen oxidase